MRCIALLALAIGTLAQAVEVADTIRVADFGAKPYPYTDATREIQQAIDACANHSGNVVLKFGQGRYDIWPDDAIRREYFITNTSSESECPSKVKTIGLLFDNLSNITIDANGTTLMMHGKITPIAFDNCHNINLKGITIDFERPGGSELTYTDIDETGVTLSVHPDSHYEIVDKRLHLIGEGWQSNKIHCIKYSPIDDHFTYSNDWRVLENADVTKLTHNLLHFSTSRDFKPQIGTTLTLRDIIRDQVGMFIYQSSDIELSNINMMYMHTLGIVSQYSHNITMHRVNCTPRPGRILASSADFMHFSGCSGHIKIDSCNYIGAQDDCINIHGTNLRGISKVSNNSLILRFMHPQSYGYQAFWQGDTIAFVQASTMLRQSTAVVTSVERLSDRTVQVSFDRQIPADFELNHDCVENITRTPSVEIRNCFFNRTDTRGILVTTPRKVIIENNTFLNLGMSAILIEADAENWYESGPVKDVTITGNKFIGCGYNGGPKNATIAINPSITKLDESKPVHAGITIIGNYFDTDGRPALYAKSAKNLTFKSNTLINTPTPYILKSCSNLEIQE